MNPVLAALQKKRTSDMQTRFAMRDDTIVIARSQDCTPIAEWAKKQQAIGAHGSSEMRHAARIPNVVIEKYCNDHGVTFAEVMRSPEHARRMLNHPDNAAFRIWPGRV